jgi:hypothetical protein
MSLKHLVAAAALTLAVATCGGFSQLAAHAAPSAGTARRAPALTCQTTVLQQTPATDYNQVVHGYLYLMRNLCDGYVFLRVSTDLWFTSVWPQLSGPTGQVSDYQYLVWGGHVDTPEVPYIRGATYSYSGEVIAPRDIYSGGGTYTAP